MIFYRADIKIKQKDLNSLRVKLDENQKKYPLLIKPNSMKMYEVKF